MIRDALGKLGYFIEFKCLNAVNYGVPQNRERMIVVGHKSSFRYPVMHKNKVTVGEAIGDLIDTVQDESKILTPKQDEYIAVYEKSHLVSIQGIYTPTNRRVL